LSDAQVQAELMKLVAAVGDGHTAMRPAISNVLPIGFYWFKEGIFVLGAAEEHKALLGGRLEMIGALTAQAACERLRPLMPFENDSSFRSEVVSLLNAADLLFAAGITESSDSAVLRVKDASGTAVTARIAAVPRAEMPNLQRAVSPLATKPFALQVLDSGKTILFEYNRCQDSPEFPFAPVRREFFQLMKDEAVQRIIIDLRYSGGGNSMIFDPVIEQMAQSRFNAPDRLFVLIGRNTYSSAVLNALSLRFMTKAKSFGEPTGGRPNHHGEIRTLQLPNSKLTVTYSTKYFTRIPDSDPPSLMPDVLVEPTFRDRAAGVDAAVEAILKSSM
jgi:hypothetical protein